MDIEDALARTVEVLRTTNGMSYRQLSAAMADVACPIEASSLQKIEKANPRRRINVNELVAFASVFHVSVADLLGTEGSVGGGVDVEGRARLIDISRQLLEIATAP